MYNEDLLRQIENGATDGSSDLSTVLRQCLILASELGNETFKNWAEWELNGYWGRGVPRYRLLHDIPSWGDIEGGSRPHGQLSFWHLSEQIRDDFQTLHVREGVAEISEKVARGQESGIMRWPWRKENYELFDPQAYQPGCRLTSAWKVAQTSSVIAVLDTIRKRVLDFVLELKKADPVAHEQTLQPPPTVDEFFAELDADIRRVSEQLYKNGHYSESVSAAFKELNHQVKQEYKRRKNIELDGADLMHAAFSPKNPALVLADPSTDSGRNTQQGFMELFAGSMIGIRNPHAHENIPLDPDRAKHFLYLASLLMKTFNSVP